MTGLGEAGAEAGTLDQLVSLTGEQAASVEEVFSVVTPAEVRRIKEENPEILSQLCFKVSEYCSEYFISDEEI